MKLKTINTSSFTIFRDCTFGVEFISSDVKKINEMLLWCSRNTSGYTCFWEWSFVGTEVETVRTFCFDTEEKRTWFIS